MLRPVFAYPAAWAIGTIFERLVPCMSGSSKRTLRMPRSFQSASTRSTEADFFSAITIASTPGFLNRPHIPVALPFGHRLSKRFDLPGARGHEVVAEALVERFAQHLVGLEGLDRALERPRQLEERAARVSVACDRRRRGELSLDSVGGGRGDCSDREVWVGVRARAAGLPGGHTRRRGLGGGA